MRSTACLLCLSIAGLGCTKSPPKEAPAAAVADGGAAGTASPKKPPGHPVAVEIPAPPDVAAPPADAEKTASGLASKVLSPGTSPDKPEAQDTVTVHYTGWTTDGKMFDSSSKRGQPATFALNGVIKGWTEGVQLMSVGEKRRFWIPVELAYNNKPGRPAGMLVFDIELVSIKRGPKPIPAPEDVTAIPKDAKTTASGLAWKQLTPPTKVKPTDDSIVKMHYTGWTVDGKMLDSSVVREQPVTFKLGSAPDGFKEGLPMMAAGEKRRFWIPKKLAMRGGGGDTPGDFLVFDIELLDVIDMSAPADVAKPPADAEKTKSGIASKVLTPGKGTTKPTATSMVSVHYTGWTTDGKMFDSSVAQGQPAQFALNGVIPGWTEGVQLMVEGEKRRFWIPEELAYKGKEGPQGTLVFDVELVKIVKQ